MRNLRLARARTHQQQQRPLQPFIRQQHKKKGCHHPRFNSSFNGPPNNNLDAHKSERHKTYEKIWRNSVWDREREREDTFPPSPSGYTGAHSAGFPDFRMHCQPTRARAALLVAPSIYVALFPFNLFTANALLRLSPPSEQLFIRSASKLYHFATPIPLPPTVSRSTGCIQCGMQHLSAVCYSISFTASNLCKWQILV